MDESPSQRAQTEAVSPIEPLEVREKELILEALKDSLWIQKDAASQLGITPRALHYKIAKFGITHPRWRKQRE